MGCVATTGELKTVNQHACLTELDNEIQAALYRRHKVSYSVPLSQRSLFRIRVTGYSTDCALCKEDAL